MLASLRLWVGYAEDLACGLQGVSLGGEREGECPQVEESLPVAAVILRCSPRASNECPFAVDVQDIDPRTERVRAGPLPSIGLPPPEFE